MTRDSLPLHVLAGRLSRSRDWHLFQAGRARIRAAEVERDIQAHEFEAQHCDELLREIAVSAPGDDGGGDAA